MNINAPVVRVKQEAADFMDLSAIGCSLPLDQLTYENSSSAHQPNTSLLTVAPPSYGSAIGGLTPYVTPYQTPFQTPNPSPLSSVQSSPAASHNASPVVLHAGRVPLSAKPIQLNSGRTRTLADADPSETHLLLTEKGIDEELAMILENDPFIWEMTPSSEQGLPAATGSQGHPIQPPPYPKVSLLSSSLNCSQQAAKVSMEDRVTGRPPPRPPQATSRTQLKQQLQRQQLEQQERRERDQSLQQPISSLVNDNNGILSSSGQSWTPTHSSSERNQSADVDIDAASAVVAVPTQVLQVRTRLENPTLYHVIQSQKRQVRQFLQETHFGAISSSLGSAQLPQQQQRFQQTPEHAPTLQPTAASAPAGGFAPSGNSSPPDAEVTQQKYYPIVFRSRRAPCVNFKEKFGRSRRMIPN